MLTDRQKEVLKIIVLEYINEARPISSSEICERLKCSSATIRSEMALLEEKGLLEKTHTSSGRVPSEKGYRYYVDNLMEIKKMSAEDMLKLQIVFKNSQMQLSDIVNESLKLISEMTNYTSIKLGVAKHDNTLKEISVVPLNQDNLTIIVVTNTGYVEHKTVSLPNVSSEDIKKTVTLINNLITGTPIDEVSAKLEYEIKPIIGNYVSEHEKLYNAFYNVFNNFAANNTNVDIVGRNNLLKHKEFNSVEKISSILEKIDDDNMYDLINNIDTDNNNINIYIGKENHLDDDMTVIETNYKTDTEEGKLVVMGPKRMDYDRVVSLLEFIKENLEG